MRIIGGHDYFDGALAYGQDPTVVLSRTANADASVMPFGTAGLEPMLLDTVRLEGSRQAWRQRSEVWTRHHVHRFTPSAVWFAGKRYGAIQVETNAADNHYGRPLSSEWFWDADPFLSFLDGVDAKLARGDKWTMDQSVSASNVEAHFSRDPTRAETDWLIENRVSIAIWKRSTSGRGTEYWKRETGWNIDVDGLGKMGFARKLDPFSAFQELSMWVGGVLPRQGNPMVEISDERTMVAKHGMDEWSFRTPPGPRS